MSDDRTDLLWPERFPRSATYDPVWIRQHRMGPNPLWLTEWMCEAIELRPGMRVLGLGCGTAGRPVSARPDATFRLGVWPRLRPIVAVLRRPQERFVMVNLLAFKEHASKPHEGRSGREAYLAYAATVEQAQGPMGSKLLWTGELDAPLLGGNGPRFEMAGLLEYGGPGAFLAFAASGRSDTKARAAGLAGQWLLACTTEERAGVPDAEADGLALLGLGGDGEPAWWGRWRDAIEGCGGHLLWSGRVDQHVIGTASPPVRRVELQALPARTQLAEFLASDAVQALRASGARPRPWWAFVARSVDLLPGLR